MFQMCALFGRAYGRAASVSIAMSGFRKSGIFHANRLVFDDSEFQPADVTDKPAPVVPQANTALNILSSVGAADDTPVDPQSSTAKVLPITTQASNHIHIQSILTPSANVTTHLCTPSSDTSSDATPISCGKSESV